MSEEEALARAEAAEAQLAEARAAGLERAAYEPVVDFADAAQAVGVADAILDTGDLDLLAAYTDQWRDANPLMLDAWAADREQVLARRAAHEHVTQSQAALDAEFARRQEIAEQFRSRHNDPYADLIASGGVGAQVPTDELAENLELMHRGMAQADRAAARADAVREAKQSFRDPSVMGVHALDPRTGERRAALPEPTEADVASRINFETPAMREARKAQQEEAFRSAFAEEARPKFLPGSKPLEEA